MFASGFCALIYQVVWTRELRVIFGASTAASSAVIAIFIAGLGFGGLWFGQRVERSARPFPFYPKLELVTPWLLELVRVLYDLTGGSLRLGIAATLERVSVHPKYRRVHQRSFEDQAHAGHYQRRSHRRNRSPPTASEQAPDSLHPSSCSRSNVS